ncbi:hypothetical protein CDAR_62591 [Caerostris darwini]|uniref:Uncharacterized protein n=1 Tax=Caerostris darwini TaxID=1538125 RepID=A0AAV4UF46_9ARAC|nr:hypothetical protein CDAR_62591 [Caerostris darwini]
MPNSVRNLQLKRETETLKYESILKYSSPIFAHDRLSTRKKEIQRERKTFCIYCRHKIATEEIQNPPTVPIRSKKKGEWGRKSSSKDQYLFFISINFGRANLNRVELSCSDRCIGT